MGNVFGEHTFLIAQIFGFMAMGLAISTYQFKSRRVIMLMITVTSVFWCLHFLTLSSYSGLAMNIINTVRAFVFSLKNENKKATCHPAIPYIFGAVSVVACIFTWEGIATLLPMAGTLFSTAANWQSDTKSLKILTVPVSGCWFFYDLISKSIAGCLNEIFVLCSIGVYFIRARKTKNTKG